MGSVQQPCRGTEATGSKIGNLTDDGESYKYVYDPLNRLVKVLNRANDALVCEYRYNGLGYMTGRRSDVTDDGTTGQPDGVVDGHDPWYWSLYDEHWRAIATYRAGDAQPKELFLHHNAGLNGAGGSSYIDSIVLRDRDANTAWPAESDYIPEERRYYSQNRRADVVAVLTDAGAQVEQVRYTAYGVPFGFPKGDVNSDGDTDATDVSAATAVSGTTLGRGVLSRSSSGNRIGYAGYRWDASVFVYHVRHRVYMAGLGRWSTRDPLGLAGTRLNNLYSCCDGLAMSAIDPFGLRGDGWLIHIPTGPYGPIAVWSSTC